MKELLIIFIAAIALGVVISAIILMRMGISSHELWDMKHKLEKEWEYMNETLYPVDSHRKRLNQLGREGWEAYGVTSGYQGAITYYFKRRKD